MLRTRFNSTLVRLRPEKIYYTFQPRSSFNSTLVRLRPRRDVGAEGEAPVFQFHSGSIKTSSPKFFLYHVAPSFQFHSGSIKTETLRLAGDARSSGFNSTLVRLRH